MLFGIYLYACGFSIGFIADELEKIGILSPTNKPVWGRQIINNILSNEKYLGDADYPWIVEKEMFDKIQARKEKSMYSKRYRSNNIGSRFWRNTLDNIRTIRLFTDMNINVYFEKENLHSLDTGNRTALELYATFAQEESKSKSKNIKWGIEQRLKIGSSSYTNRKCYGFNKGKDGHLKINDDEAIVVLNVFEMYLNGSILGEISTELENNSIPARTAELNGAGRQYRIH